MGLDLENLNAKLKGIPNPEDVLNIFKRLSQAEHDILTL
jgi:hypothetical protein